MAILKSLQVEGLLRHLKKDLIETKVSTFPACQEQSKCFRIYDDEEHLFRVAQKERIW